MTPTSNVRIDSIFEHAQAQFVEPCDLPRREELVRELRQGWATPQLQGATELLGSFSRVTGGERSSAVLGQRLEARQVELLLFELEDVAGRLREKDLSRQQLA